MYSTNSFDQSFRKNSIKTGNLCIGIDPHPYILNKWELDDNVAGLKQFVDICEETFLDKVTSVKVQVALFERFGSLGFKELERFLQSARESNTLVIADAKRGDIGSTMEAYAAAWLSQTSSLACDAMTVSPYLGFQSIEPAIDLAIKNSKTIFILAKTSSLDGEIIQLAQTKNLKSVYQEVIDFAIATNRSHPGVVGVVMGANYDPKDLLDQFNGTILIPGIGAQGTTITEFKSRFINTYFNTIPVVARSILQEGPTSERILTKVSKYLELLALKNSK